MNSSRDPLVETSPRRRVRSLSPLRPAEEKPTSPGRKGAFFCGPCSPDKTNAVAYCKECHDFFCEDHLREHDGKPATKWHRLAPTANMRIRKSSTNPGVGPSQVMTCETHRAEKLNMFCHKHDTLCCEVCAKNDHFTCGQDLKYIPAISAGIENTVEFENTRQHLHSLIERFEQLKEEKNREIEEMRENREKFLVSVKEMRYEVLELLDLIERDARAAVDAFCRHQHDEINHYKRRIDTIIESIRASSEHLKKGAAATDSEMFVNAKRAARSIAKSEKLLTSTHKTSQRVNFSFWLNSDLMGLIDLVRQLRAKKPLVSLPSTNGHRETFPVSKIHIKTAENCRSPHHCICTKPFRFRALVNAGSFSVRTASQKGDQKTCNITQCAFLPNNSFLMVDNGNKAVKLFNHSFRCVSRYKCTSGPWDLAVVDRANAVISLPDEKSIQFLSIAGKLKAGRVIAMAKKCFGVTHFKGHLFVTLGTINNAEIRMMDTQGNVVKKIYSSPDFEAFRTPKYITISNETIFVSDPYANTVTSITLDGVTSGQYKSTALLHPSGLGRDTHGNVYVCGRQSNNIHQLSPDLKVQQIFTANVFHVLQPQAISLSTTDSRVMVSTENHDLAELFTLE